MTGNGNHPEIRVSEAPRRVPGSKPILILAGLFVIATLLAWYFAWFGRELSDADISKYLADERNPRHVQHALSQIQQRMERGDGSAKNWYPLLITLSGNPETEFRLTVAWLMGFDNTVPEFHNALLKLVHDEQPLVRRNAALALVTPWGLGSLYRSGAPVATIFNPGAHGFSEVLVAYVSATANNGQPQAARMRSRVKRSRLSSPAVVRANI